MKYFQEGKGLIPLLLLGLGVVVVVVVFANKGNISNNSSNSSTSVTQNYTPAPALKLVDVMLDPATVSVAANQTVTINVKVDSKTVSVSGVDLHLSYDPAYLEATSITAGTSLPVVLVPGKVATNTATIVVGANPNSQQKGVNTVAMVTFRAKKAGMSNVMIDNSTRVVALGKNGDVKGTTTGATVTVK